MNSKTLIISILLLIVAPLAVADIYIYHGPNGERLISDRPPHPSENYALVSKPTNTRAAGRFLSNSTIHKRNQLHAQDPHLIFQRDIRGASQKFKVDTALITAVIEVESSFNPNAVSKSGATGLMQLMKKTAKQYKVRNRYNAKQNIYAGTEFLSHLLKRYQGKLPLVLAAYNAGPTAVDKYKGVPPYPETKRYIKKVLSALSKHRGLVVASTAR